MSRNSAVVTRPVAIVLDSATVVRAWQVVEMLNAGQTLAEAARNLGCSASTLCRFLKAAGYRQGQEWSRS